MPSCRYTTRKYVTCITTCVTICLRYPVLIPQMQGRDGVDALELCMEQAKFLRGSYHLLSGNENRLHNVYELIHCKRVLQLN